MSRRSSASSDPVPDIYVGLLFVAVGALLTGIVFLALELASYGWQFQ
ncbi:MAG TPA: hypothetical protein VNQ76_12315 [Planctomicrobium sp.]|nr:hypothetical protein [Planctomicrobium sp.]